MKKIHAASKKFFARDTLSVKDKYYAYDISSACHPHLSLLGYFHPFTPLTAAHKPPQSGYVHV
jgi:hypothetical protein